MPSVLSGNNVHPGTDSLKSWQALLSSCLTTLRQLAGATEHEFLQIGSRIQGIYQQSITLSQTARHLAEAASGERIHLLMDRLRQSLQEMEHYIEQAQSQNSIRCTSLSSVDDSLKDMIEPLLWFKRMKKYLYIFEVSIKIESTYMGEMQGEFANLAIDINKLSNQIVEKTRVINDNRTILSLLINKNILNINSSKEAQDSKINVTISDTESSIFQLESANQYFSNIGDAISSVSDENSNNISGIVQSMQFHDIYRQQVEHVVESLEGLLALFTEMQSANTGNDTIDHQELITKTGDVCELQEAQLQFASIKLYEAVTAIVSNLRDIGTTQRQMSRDIFTQKGGEKTSSISFIDDVREHMTSITNLLATCAGTNTEMSALMEEVTTTVDTITGFVSDIEDIGHEIIQISLNARIKAACTGKEGAALSALSEEIGHLSGEAVQRTDLITATLTAIHALTGDLSAGANSDETNLGGTLSAMETELNEILHILKNMGTELQSLLPRLQTQVNSLTGEIERITSSIDVHERTKRMADEVLGNLQQVFSEARALYPASKAFKEDLRSMAERYTMESERRIHEDLAGKHGVRVAMTQKRAPAAPKDADSEFGDNVDLF